MSYWAAIGQHFAKVLMASFVICGILWILDKKTKFHIWPVK